jgi:hypothetical protein
MAELQCFAESAQPAMSNEVPLPTIEVSLERRHSDGQLEILTVSAAADHAIGIFAPTHVI